MLCSYDYEFIVPRLRSILMAMQMSGCNDVYIAKCNMFRAALGSE
jgi:hypothetical protein